MLARGCWFINLFSFFFSLSLLAVSALALFDITERSGVLVTRRSLRGLSGGYKLLVVARDGGSPPRSSSIPVTIKVQGAEDDDGTPQWLEPSNNYIVRVEEVGFCPCADGSACQHSCFACVCVCVCDSYLLVFLCMTMCVNCACVFCAVSYTHLTLPTMAVV